MKVVSFTVLGVLVLGALAPALAQGQDLAVHGKAQFLQQGCHGCHAIGALGTPIAPDLSRIGARYSRAYLMRWLRDPSAHVPTASMPTLELSEEQVEALAAYLSSLR